MKRISGASKEGYGHSCGACQRPQTTAPSAAYWVAAQLLPEPELWSVKPHLRGQVSFQLLPVLPNMPGSQTALLQVRRTCHWSQARRQQSLPGQGTGP